VSEVGPVPGPAEIRPTACRAAGFTPAAPVTLWLAIEWGGSVSAAGFQLAAGTTGKAT